MYASSFQPLHLRLGFEFRYDGARLSGDGSRLDGYAISNVHLATTGLRNGVEVSVTLRNLLNQAFAVPGSRNNWQNAIEQDGRSVRVNVNCRF